MPTGIAQTLNKRPGDALPITVSFATQVQDADGNPVDALSRTLDEHTVTVRRTPPTLLLNADVSDMESVTIPLDQEHTLFVNGFERLIVKGVASTQGTVEGAIRDLDVVNPNLSFVLKEGIGETGVTLYITVRAQRKHRGPTEKVIQVDIKD